MRVKTFKFKDNKKIVFLPDSLRFFMTTPDTAKIMEMISAGASVKDIQSEFSDFPENCYRNFSKKLSEVSSNKIHTNMSHLGRLVINVSNDCNMRCRYCYANGGSYKNKRNLITRENLTRTLDLFYELFHSIEVIQLFGGEPTLNLEAIRNVGEYVYTHNYQTQVGFVTNGTLINDDLIEIINKYHMNVTVSIDVEQLHNELRPFNNNRPSYNLIRKNILYLQQHTSQPSQFEITYTKRHIDQRISILDIIRELSSQFGNVPIHIAPVCSENPEFKLLTHEAFVNSVEEVFNAKRQGECVNYSMLNTLELNLKHHFIQEYVCGAGVSTLAVSTIGEIYPCFYFIDNPDFCIGNIYDSKEAIFQKLQNTREYYLAHKKKQNRCMQSMFCKYSLPWMYRE